jgi:hypothetical protein
MRFAEQINLFNYKERLEDFVRPYANEFHILSALRRNEAIFAGDGKAVALVKRLREAGTRLDEEYRKGRLTFDRFVGEITDIMTQLWCVTINGTVSRHLFDRPISQNRIHPGSPPESAERFQYSCRFRMIRLSPSMSFGPMRSSPVTLCPTIT